MNFTVYVPYTCIHITSHAEQLINRCVLYIGDDRHLSLSLSRYTCQLDWKISRCYGLIDSQSKKKKSRVRALHKCSINRIDSWKIAFGACGAFIYNMQDNKTGELFYVSTCRLVYIYIEKETTR